MPALTTIKDTLYDADGSTFSGRLVIINEPFISADGFSIPGRQRTVGLSDGVLRTYLVPNTGSTPNGTSYLVRYYANASQYYEQTWQIPSTSPISNPSAPSSVVQSGTPGSTTYYYWVSAVNATGETELSASTVTTTSNATLSGSNYNIITWAAVTGATSYRVWRTSTSTEPSGTGSYLVGSTASTTINDQSNSLTSATVPSVNDTDFKTVAQVAVTTPVTGDLTITAAQVTGTAVVQNPTSEQIITAPTSTGPAVTLRGRSGNSDNLLKVQDSSGTLVAYGKPGGTFKFTNVAQGIAQFASGDTSPSVAGGKFFRTANASPTSIHTFDDAIAGQEVVVNLGDANTTFVSTTNIRMPDSSFNGNAGDCITFYYDGTVFWQVSRSENLATEFVTMEKWYQPPSVPQQAFAQRRLARYRVARSAQFFTEDPSAVWGP